VDADSEDDLGTMQEMKVFDKKQVLDHLVDYFDRRSNNFVKKRSNQQ
jgi:hypothetical protein